MRRYSVKYTANVIGLGMACFAASRYLIALLGAKLKLTSAFWGSLGVMALTLAASLLLMMYVINRMMGFRPEIDTKKAGLPEVLMRPACMLLMAGGGLVNQMLLRVLERSGISFSSATLMKTVGVGQLSAYFLYMTVLPAVLEELVCRGVIFGHLRLLGEKFGIFASAFIFMLMHTRIQDYIPIFISGVILATIYSYTESIYAPMFLHFLNNRYSFRIAYMEQNTTGLSPMGFATFMSLLLIVIGGVSFWLLYKSSNRFLSPLAKWRGGEEVMHLFTGPVFILGTIALLIPAAARLWRELM